MRKILLALMLSIFLIGLVSAFQTTESPGFHPYTSSSGANSHQGGMTLNVTYQSGINILSYNISALSTANKCYLWDMSNSTLYTGTLATKNCSFTSPIKLEYGTNAILFTNNSAWWDHSRIIGVTYPRTGTFLYWVRGNYIGLNYSNEGFEIDTVVINIPSAIENNVSIISQKYNSSSVETKLETFILNITANGTDTVTARLIYNNIDYGLGTSSGTNANLQFLKTINIPSITPQNKSIPFYWNITWNGLTDILQYDTQFVNMFQFGLCNTTIKTKFMNLSFKDESTNNFINASLPSANFIYWLDTQTLNKSYTLINNTNNYEYDFCSSTTDYALTSIANIQYQGTDYPQRLFTNTLSLSNVSTNKTLYLLSSVDGIYVTFQVQNANTEQTISGVDVFGTRLIDGSNTLVALGTTDSAGSVTFWLNPDFSHTFNFTKSGYDTFTTSIFPTQSSYTISMTSGTGSTTSTDYTKGIVYTIKPSGDFLKNGTIYNFNYSLSSSFWDVEQFGFGIYYGNGSLAGSTSAVTNGGFLSVNANVTNQTSMRMNYYYIINSTSYNGTRTWYVETGGTSFSILHFFDDLTLYMGVGFFGIDDFGRVILSLFIIIMVVGGVAMRYGIQNEAMLMGVLFGLVYFFDIGIGLIPAVTFGGNSIPHFVTIAAGLLLTGFLIKEESR
jgi:hypothetical protein